MKSRLAASADRVQEELWSTSLAKKAVLNFCAVLRYLFTWLGFACSWKRNDFASPLIYTASDAPAAGIFLCDLPAWHCLIVLARSKIRN